MRDEGILSPLQAVLPLQRCGEIARSSPYVAFGPETLIKVITAGDECRIFCEDFQELLRRFSGFSANVFSFLKVSSVPLREQTSLPIPFTTKQLI
jgi:hypothetical protein